jgi:hypothetical protein
MESKEDLVTGEDVELGCQAERENVRPIISKHINKQHNLQYPNLQTAASP